VLVLVAALADHFEIEARVGAAVSDPLPVVDDERQVGPAAALAPAPGLGLYPGAHARVQSVTARR
jgi:hypothetical protein